MNLGAAVVLWAGGGAVIDDLRRDLARSELPADGRDALVIFGDDPAAARGRGGIRGPDPRGHGRHTEVRSLDGALSFEVEEAAVSRSREWHSRTPRATWSCTTSTWCWNPTTTAVLGATGPGKSTLVNLVSRFHDLTAGRVTLDGHDLRHLDQSSLRRSIGFAQQALLFEGTIADNIGTAPRRPGQRSSVHAAQAHDFIIQLDGGYDAAVEAGNPTAPASAARSPVPCCSMPCCWCWTTGPTSPPKRGSRMPGRSSTSRTTLSSRSGSPRPSPPTRSWSWSGDGRCRWPPRGPDPHERHVPRHLPFPTASPRRSA